jgi:ubiquinone/menaquinone biosynthesis C-methylase UbiE
MPDVWADVSRLDQAAQERLAGVLETRGADEKQQQMRRDFLALIDFPPVARVIDIGCGTGVLTRRLAREAQVTSVVGVDLAESLLVHARELCADVPELTFEQADASDLPFDDGSFDVAVLDSTLSHVPHAERAVAEAIRVLRRPGILAVFDGNYSTTTVALGDHDPLQACVDAMMTSSVTDRWLMRRLPALMRDLDVEVVHYGSHAYVETDAAEYLLTIVDRGADILETSGLIGSKLCASLKEEARQRTAEGRFFGQITYVSLIARTS